MTESDMIAGIAKLKSREDYAMWKFQVSILCKSKEIFEVLNGTTEKPTEKGKDGDWNKKDAMAQRYIMATVDLSVLIHLMNCTSSAEMWTKLAAIYGKTDETQLSTLFQEFYIFRFDRNSAVTANVSKLENLFNRLKSLDDSLKDTMLVSRILTSLPENYRHFITSWEMSPAKDQTLENLTKRLMSEENREKQQSEEPVAFMVKERPKASRFKKGKSYNNGNKSKGNTEEQGPKCYNCNQYAGHFASQCTVKMKKCGFCGRTNHKESECFKKEKKNEKNEKTKSEPQVKVGWALNDAAPIKSDQEWVVDTGSTKHVTNNAKILSELIENPQEIGTAKIGDFLNVEGTGIANYADVTLSDVHYAPDLTTNLLSVDVITEKGGVVIFDKNGVTFTHEGKVVLKGIKGSSGLFTVKLGKPEKESLAYLAPATKSAEMWHRKMGHLSFKNLRRLSGMSQGIDAKIPDYVDCETCLRTDSKRKKFDNNRTKADSPLSIVSSDICGPLDPPTHDNKRYFLTFYDEFTKFTMIELLSAKSETFEKLVFYVNNVERKWSMQVKTIRCDNGGEYRSSNLQQWCKEKGITIDYTTPGTPELNGSAERLNYTIIRKAKAMLADSNLSKEFWGEAVRMAGYLANRSPKEGIDVTPYEKWNGKAPDLKHLEVFGTVAYVKQKVGPRKKLDDKSFKCFHIGYTNNGFRLWDTQRQKVIASRDVVFVREQGAEKNNENASPDIFEREKEIDMSQTGSDEEREDEAQEEKERDDRRLPDEPNQVSTRSGRKVKAPERYGNPIPSDIALLTYSEALSGPDSEKWMKAIDDEKSSLMKNQTWKLVNIEEAKGRKPLTSRWVLREKEEGVAKARLVVRGFEQKEGIDYDEIFSPVANFTSIRTLFCIAAAKGMKIAKFDVKTAFLYGKVKEELFMEIPEGFEKVKGKICKLLKSIYGLKQAPSDWKGTLTTSLLKAGWICLITDPCIFKSQDGKAFIGVHVDDILAISEDWCHIDCLNEKLSEDFEMKMEKNPSSYLNIAIEMNEKEIRLSQTGYTETVLKNFGMHDAKPVATPMIPAYSKTPDPLSKTKFQYREAVGSLLYLSNKTRPDIAFAVSYASRFLDSPKESDVETVKRTLRYLKGNSNDGIAFKREGDLKLEIFCDSDFAGDVTTRKSTSGYVIFLNKGPVTWTSRKQSLVALSSTDAEFIAATEAARELIRLTNFLNELIGQDISKSIFIDNQGAIQQIKNGIFTKGTKHIEVKEHFLHERYMKGDFQLNYIPTNENVADILTKALQATKFNLFKRQLMSSANY